MLLHFCNLTCRPITKRRLGYHAIAYTRVYKHYSIHRFSNEVVVSRLAVNKQLNEYAMITFFWEFNSKEFRNGSAGPQPPPIVEYCHYSNNIYKQT